MVKEHVRLEEAMTMDIEQPCRVWSVSGLHVEDEDIPKDANVKSTIVAKSFDGERWAVGVDFSTVSDDNTVPNYFIGTIAEFSSLEELRKTFPQLFELEGELFAFP